MFALCKNMRWNHLPVAGGVYDQDPVMMDQFMILWNLEAAKAKREHEEEKRKMQAERNKSKR